MQITPILICLVSISVVQGIFRSDIPKPKLNLVHSQNFKSSEITKPKSPEERRKLPLFPKSYMKYVISSEPIYTISTHKPIVHETKKPLMKKLIIQDKKNIVVDNVTKQPIINTENLYDSNIAVTPTAEPVLNSEEVSIEIVKEKSEESNENQNDSVEEDKLQNNHDTIKASADAADKESLNLKDIILPLKAKPVEIIPENKSEENISNIPDTTKNSEENETPDVMEFIFIDPTESDNSSSEEPEEYVTTEFYEEPKILRRKRRSNVIEEENLASTVAGYKYTWKDTRLNNDLAFKNINS